MKKNLIIAFSMCALLSSCYFVDDIFDPPKEKEPSLQERSQESVSKYLRINTNGTYESFGFGGITIHKPIEIIELEKLEQQAEGGSNPELDTTIAQKRRYIEANNIERTVDLDHFFTITDSLGDIRIFETNFILNDTLGVKDLSAKIVTTISSFYEDALNYYFYEYNIFLTDSYYESRTLSANFYAFFKKELEKREGLNEKSAFLLHVIKLTHEVKARGEFDQQEILQENVKEYIMDERTDIEQYEYLEFSELYQTQEEGSADVSSYYFFHKFIGSYQGQLDTNVVMVEFSPFYEISNIYQMERPFATYFK